MANTVQHQNYLPEQNGKYETDTITDQHFPDLGQAHEMWWG